MEPLNLGGHPHLYVLLECKTITTGWACQCQHRPTRGERAPTQGNRPGGRESVCVTLPAPIPSQPQSKRVRKRAQPEGSVLPPRAMQASPPRSTPPPPLRDWIRLNLLHRGIHKKPTLAGPQIPTKVLVVLSPRLFPLFSTRSEHAQHFTCQMHKRIILHVGMIRL